MVLYLLHISKKISARVARHLKEDLFAQIQYGTSQKKVNISYSVVQFLCTKIATNV